MATRLAVQLAEAKQRKSLTGTVYTTLHELALERINPPVTSSAVDCFLAQYPSYLCKRCFATLTKFANIKENLEEICCALQHGLQQVSVLNKQACIYKNYFAECSIHNATEE